MKTNPNDRKSISQDSFYEKTDNTGDYSSAAFDYAYIRPPLLCVPFDRTEVFGGEHDGTEGCFDCERDGLGEAETDPEGTADRIPENMENICRKEKPRTYRPSFAFSDRDNCRRVYEKRMDFSQTDER